MTSSDDLGDETTLNHYLETLETPGKVFTTPNPNPTDLCTRAFVPDVVYFITYTFNALLYIILKKYLFL